jgi:curved DNA-binding protein CbpA
LDGYVVDIRLGRRPCHLAEAVEAVRSAARAPRARGRAQSRPQPDEQPDEPREPRWRGSRPAGESAAGSARRGASAPGPGPRQDSSGSDRAENGTGPRQESSRSDRTGAGPGSWGHRGRESAAAPRAASGPSAAEFFLSKTGLRPPYNLDALKRAFRLGARALHPDVRPGASEAHREFCLFKEGYEELVRGVTR